MASSSSRQKSRLASIIRLRGYLDTLPCIHCLFDHPCVRMPSVSVKCARCAESGRKNCVSVTWEVVERTILSTREAIEKDESLIDEDDEEEAELETKLREIKDRRLARKRRVRRNRKVLKRAEGRADAQAKCLAEELDNEASEAYVSAWEGQALDFGPELLELAAHTPSLLHEVVDGSPLAGPSSSSVPVTGA